MQKLKHITAFILLFVCTHFSWAQDDCEQTLRNALEEFNAGHFYGLTSILKPCLNHGFTLEQQQRAYLLLTQTYLLIDDPIAAEDSYLKLLKANPVFVTDATRDPIDVVYLSKKFTAAPIFSLFARIGGNVSIVRMIKDIDLYDGVNGQDLPENYTIRPGFQLNIGGDWHILDRISISGGVQYMLTSYRHTTTGIFGRDVLEFTDQLKWFNIPLSIKYSSIKGSFSPFFYLGYSTNFLIGDKATVNYQNRELSFNAAGVKETTLPNTPSPNLNLRYKRNLINNAIFVGAGVKRKIGLNYWFVDVRYSFGLRNIFDTENHYADYNSSNYKNSLIPLMLYGQTEDYFRLDNLSLSVGYIHPIYKPRKLKHARTKSVLKDLRKQKK